MATKQMLIGTILKDFFPQTTSMDFNGVDEAIRTNTQQSIGIANDWSILIWIRRSSAGVGTTGNNTILQIFGSGPPNRSRIFIRGRGDVGNDPIEVETTSSSGAVIKIFRWNVAKFPFNTWLQMIVTWNGSALNMYKDGVLTAVDSLVNNGSGTMAETNRLIQIGRNGGVQPFRGNVHSIAVYNTDVGAAAAELYNGGTASTFDLSKASFNANLQHWWRLGQDPLDIGKDSGIGSLLIDVATDSLNMDASDISSESPA